MVNAVEIGGLRVDDSLYRLLMDEISPGTGVHPDAFWAALGRIVADLEPVNRALLEKRDALQARIDAWHLERKGRAIDREAYRAFLKEIGYLAPEGDPFQATTANVDAEIAEVSGPQLVAPVDDARLALDAANARWGSLFDALYETDMIPEDDGAEKTEGYNPVRGAKAMARIEAFLDDAVGLARGSYSEVTGFSLRDGERVKEVVATLGDGRKVGLADTENFAGYREKNGELTFILLKNNRLHIEIRIDRAHPIGSTHPAGIRDVILEAAVTTILDCEDTVAAVDAGDKVGVYRNWNGMMQGSLEVTSRENGQEVRMNPDRMFLAPDGEPFTLPGRSVMLLRHVGMHMYTDCVTTADGREIPEGFLDAMVTSLAAIHDLRGTGTRTNSRAGSIYIVKPKLHGPEEVAATVTLFERVEDALGLERNTLKIGIMDEERRTSVNLKAAVGAARERVAFINTGFLDRTGDEIHTSMEAGPVLPKVEIKDRPWFAAYEDRNVDIGLETGLAGRAQIGKGMWTRMDAMREMLATKGEHPMAGAGTAWVPSPTAAVLHAMHYHRVNVVERQAELAGRERAGLGDILTPPLLDRELKPEEVRRELENNAQGILGYVVRWIDRGIGCSKVPDIDDVGLLEDRATVRISSQHIANWLHHGIVSEWEVRKAFERMARVVDRQNGGDPDYRNMAPGFGESIAFQAALDLVLQGREAANGYTESVLHARRRAVKRRRREQGRRR